MDNGVQPFQSIRSEPSNAGGVFITASVRSDAVTLGNMLTINAGVRFDHSRAISQDLHAVDQEGTRPATSSTVLARVHVEYLVAAWA